MTTRFLKLGASLYVPATRPHLAPLANGHKYPQLRSVIFCAEDAVEEWQVAHALENLETAFRALEPTELMRFVRVRILAVLRYLLGLSGIEGLTGFVLPKVTRKNLEEYLDAFAQTDPFDVMLTLETAEVFDILEMLKLRDLLLAERWRHRILSLRIGGNDLFSLLCMRRPRQRTIYRTPLAATINQLVTVFRPHGFNLTGPVLEYLDAPRLLAREVREDLAHGLFGKTAIHPSQVPVIEAQYKVSVRDLATAEKILLNAAPAVFRQYDAMCEPATHRNWALLIQERARLYGVGELRTMGAKATGS